MLDPEAVRDFLAVAELGSFAEAERARGLPRSSLSRRIAGLEQRLGVRLLERNSRKVRLTDEGVQFRERASRLTAQWAELEDEMHPGHGPLAGRLRVSVPVLFGQTLLGRIGAAFALAHPQVLLEAVVDDRHVDLLRDGFDAAIRVNPRDADLTGRIVGRNDLVLVASSPLARRLGYPGRGVDEIVWPAVVRQGWGDDGFWDVVSGGTRFRVAAQPRLSLSSPLAVRDAVLAEAGAGLLPRTLVRSDIADGRLVELGTRAGAPEEIWIVHASGRLPSRRVRAFADLVEAHLAPTLRHGRDGSGPDRSAG